MGYLFIEIDHHLVTHHPTLLRELAHLYCETWRYDQFFGEYTKCSSCKHYFSFDYSKNHTTCPDCGNILVPAWVEAEVEQDIIKATEKGREFYGAVAITPDTVATPVGFVWGERRHLSQVKHPTVLEAVDNNTGYVTYFSEIGVDSTLRVKGIGSTLCRMLVSWMKRTYPELPGYLHTHFKSPARRLFEKAGYQHLCDDEILGGGRIFMSIDFSSHLTPENL